jgi:hypothetical protein
MLQINKKWARALGALGLAAIVGLVAGCGGGGGSSSTSSTGSGSTSPSGGNTTTTTPTTTTTSSTTGGATGRNLVPSAAVAVTPPAPAGNIVTVAVASGVAGAANIPTVSVTVCVHGTSTCQTINNIQLDTGSYGLRLTSDALNSTMLSALPLQTVGSQAVAECMGFADGNSWGSVRVADVQIGGEAAPSMPIQIFGDVQQSQAGSVIDNSCAVGTLHNSSTDIGANGILGIGTAKYDCGTGCQNSAANGVYFGCTVSGGTLTGCTPVAVPNSQQVANPVQSFTSGDINGVILTMPTVGATGARSASGYLTFGLGTQSNNAVPSTGIQTFTTDHFGDVQSATLDGTTYTDTSQSQRAAFFDTGSNGLFLPGTHSSLPLCTGGSGFYCPASAVNMQPTVTGFNGATATLPISIENALDLFGDGGLAFSNLGGNSGLLAVDFGMPFFYGKTVYITYDTASSGLQNVGTTASVAF